MMDPVTQFLLSIAGIFLIGALGEVIFQRTNIPDVIWLILAGIVLGPIGNLVTREMLGQIAPFFAAVTLVVVLFEGGTTLKLTELSRAAPRSTLLAVMSFAVSVVAMAGICYVAAWAGLLPESWGPSHGIMVGTILGGSSSIIIMPAMAQARMQPRLANLVNLESALTDAFCVVGTSALIGIMVHGGGDEPPIMVLGKSFGIGLAIGLGAGLVWLLFLRALRSSEHAYPLTLSALLILYVVIDGAGGSAALGILAVAIMLGNAPLLGKVIGLAEPVSIGKRVKGFHTQMAFMVKSFFFVFIGAMLGPPWSMLAFGVVLGLILLVARLPAIHLAMVASGFSSDEKKMITVSMPRGMAAGVLATLPMAAGVPDTEQLPVIVFACVFTTILIFAVGFPMIKNRMPVGDPQAAPLDLPAGAAAPSVAPPAHRDAAAAAGLVVPPHGGLPKVDAPARDVGNEPES